MPATISSLIKWLKAVPTRRIFATVVFVAVVLILIPNSVQANSDPMSCTSFLNVNIQGCVNLVVAKVGEIVLMISAKAVLITGILFNIAMKLTVNMAAFIDNMPIVLETWRTIRDMCSIVFVFALIYQAFLQIFGKGNPKKLIVDIVIAGLLINFSYFIGRTAIDLSNIVSIQFYRAMLPAQTCPTCVTGQDSLDGGISTALMQGLKVQSLYNNVDQNAQGDNVAKANAQARPIWDLIFQMYFGSVILFTVAGIFLMASLMFLARMAYAILLLTLSPLYFVSRVIPGMGGEFGGSWQKNMETIVKEPIVFLFLLYVGLKIVLSDTFSKTINGGGVTDATFANAAAGIGSSITVIGQYVIVLILLGTAAAAALKVGGDNALSKGLADNANKFTGWLKTKYGKYTPHEAMKNTAVGGAKAIGRIPQKSVGFMASRLAKPDDKNSWNITKSISAKTKSLAARGGVLGDIATGALNATASVGGEYDKQRKTEVTDKYNKLQTTIKNIGTLETPTLAALRVPMQSLKDDLKTSSEAFSAARGTYTGTTQYQDVQAAKAAYDKKLSEVQELKVKFSTATDPAQKATFQNQLNAETTNLNTLDAAVKTKLAAAQQTAQFAAYKTASGNQESARKAIEAQEKAIKEAEKTAKGETEKQVQESRKNTLFNRTVGAAVGTTEMAALDLVGKAGELKDAKEEKKKFEADLKKEEAKLAKILSKIGTSTVVPFTTTEEAEYNDFTDQISRIKGLEAALKQRGLDPAARGALLADLDARNSALTPDQRRRYFDLQERKKGIDGKKGGAKKNLTAQETIDFADIQGNIENLRTKVRDISAKIETTEKKLAAEDKKGGGKEKKDK